MAELSGHPLSPETAVPEAWRSYVAERYGRVAPLRMTDGVTPVVTDWSTGYDPGDPVDRAVLATRRAVFPHHGLDPERD
jgi:acetoin utilization protein AcuC